MICMIGTDHTLAPVQVRSLFSCSKTGRAQLTQKIMEQLHADGAVMLDTCNRLELWINIDEPGEDLTASGGNGGALSKDPLFRAFCAQRNVDPGMYARFFRGLRDEEAVRHLFRLTCGLESAILAEDQILSQVRESLTFARKAGTTDGCMEVLFRMAVTAAKLVKTEVVFSRANATAVAQAVQMLKNSGYEMAGKVCMVIGNGEYGKLAANTLREAGADVTVTVRQYHSGMVQIPKGCKRINYGERLEFLPACDLVVSATASPHYTLEYEEVAKMRLKKPLVLLDLAVPADMNPGLGRLENVTLYNIDDFSTADDGTNAEAFAAAERILRKEEDEFWFWLNSRDLVPRVHAIRRQAVTDLNLRIRKIMRELPLEEDERKQLYADIDKAAGNVIRKMLFDLQDHVPDAEFRDFIDGLEKVYDTDD